MDLCSKVVATGLLAAAVGAGTLAAPAQAAPPGASCKVTVTVTLMDKARFPLSLPGKVGDDGRGCGSLPQGMVNLLAGVLGRISGGEERARNLLGRGLVPCATDRTLGSAGNNVHITAVCGEGITS